MALGRHADSRLAPSRDKRGPQSFITDLLLEQVQEVTRTRRAGELTRIPKRSGTYFGPYKPGSAQRIPPLADVANPNNVRATLVARSRLLLTILQKQQGAA